MGIHLFKMNQLGHHYRFLLFLPFVHSRCETDFNTKFKYGFIREDNTIRAYSADAGRYCFKKDGDKVRYGHCKIGEQQLDNILSWEFEPHYGTVKNKGTNACWSIASVTRRNEQFLRM